MSVGTVSRAKSIGYTSGSIYKRHGIASVQKQGNLQRMNRETVDSYNASFTGGGTLVFDVLSSANTSRSEQIAEQVVARVQSEAQAALTSYSLGDLLDQSA